MRAAMCFMMKLLKLLELSKAPLSLPIPSYPLPSFVFLNRLSVSLFPHLSLYVLFDSKQVSEQLIIRITKHESA